MWPGKVLSTGDINHWNNFRNKVTRVMHGHWSPIMLYLFVVYCDFTFNRVVGVAIYTGYQLCGFALSF